MYRVCPSGVRALEVGPLIGLPDIGTMNSLVWRLNFIRELHIVFEISAVVPVLSNVRSEAWLNIADLGAPLVAQPATPLPARIVF